MQAACQGDFEPRRMTANIGKGIGLWNEGRMRFGERLRPRLVTFTADFAAYLEEHLLQADPQLAARVPVRQWLYEPTLPGTAPTFRAEALEAVEEQVRAWAE